jgi:uncharacterized membrane protein YphA (DoxX/SURF4 family)
LRRLFPIFLRGRPAIGLLLLRTGIAAAVVSSDHWTHPVESIASVLIAIGVWTPVSGMLVALTQLWYVVTDERTPSLAGLLAVTAVALLCTGPGAWSIDARLYGMRRIEISNSRRSRDDAH